MGHEQVVLTAWKISLKKKFCEPSMEASIAMTLCFSTTYDCQMRLFLVAAYLLGLPSKQIFMSVLRNIILQSLLVAGPHTPFFSLPGAC